MEATKLKNSGNYVVKEAMFARLGTGTKTVIQPKDTISYVETDTSHDPEFIYRFLKGSLYIWLSASQVGQIELKI